MGQTVKLRRSAISGKIPINSQLQLGELSMNTTDGKIFLSKSGSNGPSVEEVIITNTQNNGSIDIAGSISGSFLTGSFIGDGSELYNIPASGVTGLSLDRIASSTSTASIDADGLHINTDTTVTGSLTATEFTGSGLGLTDVPIKISGSDAGSTSIDSTFTRIKFDDSTGIKISGTTGGDAVVYLSGVAAESESSEGRTAKLEVTSATSTWTLNHNLNEKHPSIEVFDSNDEVIIPQKIEATSVNQVVVSFASPQTGTVTATVGGGLPSIDSGYENRVLSVGDNGIATWKTGILSGSIDFSTLVDTGSFNTYTSSNDNTNSNQNGRLDSLEEFTSSIDDTYATDNDVTTLRTDLNTYTSSTDGRLDSLETTSGSSNLRLDYIESVTSSHHGRLNSLETISGSHDGRLDSIESKTGSFLVSNDLSTIEGKIGSLETTSGSHEGKLSSLETISASHDGRLDSLETTSGSHNGRLTNLETFETKVDTGLEFTGSNVTIKGNLLVKGTETRVNSTTVDIDDNILSLNGSGAANAGIEVRDTESPGVLSGSLIYDTGDNTWKAGIKGSEERLLINSDLTTLDGRLDSLESTSGSHEDRLDRIETSTSSLNSFTSSINTTIKDKLNNDGVISGSVQIDHDATTNYEANEHIDHTTITIGSGKGLTGGGTIDTSRSLTLNTGSNHFLDGVKSKLNTETVVSGSEQIDITGTTNYNLVDGRLDSIESFTSSIDLTYATDNDVTDLRNDLNSYTSSNDDTNGTQNGRLNSLETTSGSHDGRLDSLETTSGSHNSRLDSIESNTGSYLTSYNDEYTTGATFSTSNGVVTFTRNDGDQYTVDLDGRYLTSFTETDPVFTAHAAYDITSTQITNWDTAYGWGDHSQAGYLTSYNNEYTTGATFNGSNGIITFTRNDGDTYTLNISSTLTDINVTGGTYDDSTQTLTLNKSNGSSIDVTGFAVDTVLHTTGATFDTSDGLVTFTKNGGDTYTVDLDGRYLTSFTETDPVFTAHAAYDITSTNIENWNTAYGWGDHSQAGYLTSYNNEYTTGATFNSGDGVVTFTRNDGDQFTVDLDGRYLTSYNDEYTTGATFNSGNGVITFTRNDGDTFTVDIDGRFLTSFTETDPIFTAHAAYDITSTQITNWDTAYGWGDHGTAGYLTSYNNEYTTGATFNGGNGIITFTRNDGDTFTLDISATLTDINVTGGTYDDSTQTLTLNKSNGGSIDISGFAVDTVLHTTGATFDTSDGLVTFTKNNNTTFSVDLDGRYSLSSHNHDSTYLKLAGGTLTGGLNGTTGTFSGKGTFDNLELTSGNRHLTITESGDDWSIMNTQQNNGIILYNGTGGVEIQYSGTTIAEFENGTIKFHEQLDMGTNIITDTKVGQWDTAYGWGDHGSAGYLTSYNDEYTTGATFNTGTGVITFTRNDGDTYTVDIDGRYLTSYNDEYTTGATFNTSNGIITFTRNDGDTFTVDLDGKYSDITHKYHKFNDNDEFYDGYGQANYLRLFTENAVHDNFRFRSWSNLEYWNGSSWVSWSQNIDTLFDGLETTGFNLSQTHKKFRFEINRSSGWPTTALFVIQSTWSDISSTTGSVVLETNDGSQWNQKDSWTYGSFQRGYNLYTTTQTHDGKTNMRVTIDLSWTNNSHDYFPLRRILMLSNYSGNQYDMKPFTWEYNQDVTFANNIKVSGGESTEWNTAYGWGDHSQAGYLTSSSTQSKYLRSDTDDQTTGTLTIGDGTADTRLIIKRVDGSTSDDIQFFNGTTRMGEIGTQDTTWLRINQNTSKNIYTPRYMRADGGFFVDGTSKGINGSGNFIGGTIAGASDANVTNWDTAYEWGDHGSVGYLTDYNDEYTTGATFNTSNGVVTFTRNDGDTFTVDLDGRYLTSYNDEYTTGATFNGSNGIITFTRNDGDTYTVDISSTLTDINVTGGTYDDSTQTLTLNKSNGNSVDVTGFAVDTVLHTTGATFNSGDGVITFTKNGGDTYTVDIDGRFLTSYTETQTLDDVTTLGATTSNDLTVGGLTISDTFPYLDFVDTNSFTDTADRFRIRAGGNNGQIQWSDSSAGTISTLMTFLPDGEITMGNGIGFTATGGVDMGTNTITDTKVGQWNTAYGWGDHSQAGYITSQATDFVSKSSGGQFDGLITIKEDTNTSTTDGKSLLTLHNENSDISQQQSFIDFKFTDTNANYTPQVRIGAQVGPDADANAISKEGAGSFVVYTAPVGSDESGNSSGLAEQFRVSYNGTVTAQGQIVATGGNSSQWNTAYGWGDHGSAGYLTSETYTSHEDTSTLNGLYGGADNGIVVEDITVDSNGHVTAVGTRDLDGRFMIQGQTLADPDIIENGGNRYDPSTNSPTNEHYAILTYGNGGNVTGQLATHFQTGKLYSRGHNNSWSGWRTYWSDSDFTSTDTSNWDTAYGWGNHASAGYITSPDGGNAGLLDGIDSGEFLRSNVNDTFTGTITMGTQKALVANNYGRGVYGLYSATRYQHVWSMGTAYNLSDDGTSSGNLYGLAFTHTNIGGQSKTGLAHQLLIMDNGITKSAIGRGIWTDGTITTTSHGDSSQWNTAYGWGDHSSGGYLTSSSTLNASNMTTGTLPDVMSSSTRYNIGFIDGSGSQNRDKIRVWDSSSYTIGMKNGYDFGHIGSGEYAMSFQMDTTTNRGWWWGTNAQTDDQGVMALTNQGRLNVATSISIGEGMSTTSPSTTPLYVEGTTAGDTVFEVQGTSGQLFSITDSLIGDIFEVSDISGIPILTVNSSGVVTVDDTLHVTGDVIAYYASDRRLKDNIKPIENAIDKIKMIGGYEFDWNINSRNNEGHDVGVIAQEIEEVLPELVGTRSDGYKGVKYEKLTALLIQSNKELIQRVEELEEKLNKSE